MAVDAYPRAASGVYVSPSEKETGDKNVVFVDMFVWNGGLIGGIIQHVFHPFLNVICRKSVKKKKPQYNPHLRKLLR